MAKWELMEREIRQFGYPSNTASKFKILTSIIMALSISELFELFEFKKPFYTNSIVPVLIEKTCLWQLPRLIEK